MPTFSPGFLDELRARTPLPPLVGRRVKLARAGRLWKGCCPFHGERTPSFHVYDDHFHCFGCGAHGDAIAFLMQADGQSFPDAVATLAGEAGLELPADKPGERAERSREAVLLAALDAASRRFERALADDARAAPARAYLDNRGIGPATRTAHRLGWAAGQGLRDALAAEGHPPDLLLAAGLLHAGEDGAIRGEMFRERVTFPITDRRGRVCGFGARTLGDGQPKYLNGPETPVFSKRRLLYGRHRAAERRRVRAGAPPPPSLVLAEGYMDVIALDEAGFAACAPLGTALGEEQLAEAWQLDNAPVLCLDGDAAGQRATRRALERALPLLTPERTLRIARLDAGEDPDSLLRRAGPDALRHRIDTAQPLVTALYDLLDKPDPAAGPEARAAFRARLEAAAAAVADRALCREYRAVLLDRFFAEGRLRRPGGAPHPGAGGPPRPVLSADATRAERAAYLAVIALNHPALIHHVEDAWSRLELPPWLASLRDDIIGAAGGAETLDSAQLLDHLREAGSGGSVDQAGHLLRRKGVLHASARPGAMPAAAEAGWWHFFGLIQHAKLDDEIRCARDLLEQDVTEARQLRLVALVEARAEALALDNEPD